MSEERLREAAADCRAFARLEERGLLDELAARYGDLRNSGPPSYGCPSRPPPAARACLLPSRSRASWTQAGRRSCWTTRPGTSSRPPGARRLALAAAPDGRCGIWRWPLPSATPCAQATCFCPQAAAMCRSGTWSWASGSGPRRRRTPTPGCLSHPAPKRACGPSRPLRRGRGCGGAQPAQQPVRPHPGWRTPVAPSRRAADHSGRAQASECRWCQPAAGAR